MDASRCVGRQTITTGTGDECTLNMQAVLHHKAHPSFKHAWREQTRKGSKTMSNATTGRRAKGVGWKVKHHVVSMWQGLHVCAYTDAACSFLQTPSNPQTKPSCASIASAGRHEAADAAPRLPNEKGSTPLVLQNSLILVSSR